MDFTLTELLKLIEALAHYDDDVAKILTSKIATAISDRNYIT